MLLLLLQQLLLLLQVTTDESVCLDSYSNSYFMCIIFIVNSRIARGSFGLCTEVLS